MKLGHLRLDLLAWLTLSARLSRLAGPLLTSSPACGPAPRDAQEAESALGARGPVAVWCGHFFNRQRGCASGGCANDRRAFRRSVAPPVVAGNNAEERPVIVGPQPVNVNPQPTGISS